MSADLNKHPLFQQIISEHQVHLGLIQQAVSIQDKKNILDQLWSDIENDHHLKEEQLIYPVLFNKKKLTEGGPFCALYFDEHVLNRPADVVKKLSGQEISWLQHQIFYKENQSPLNIPLEEHRSARQLLKYLIENKNHISESDFLQIFEGYVRLLKHHNTKEEKCFFRVCEVCLSQTELDDIFSKWSNF